MQVDQGNHDSNIFCPSLYTDKLYILYGWSRALVAGIGCAKCLPVSLIKLELPRFYSTGFWNMIFPRTSNWNLKNEVFNPVDFIYKIQAFNMTICIKWSATL